MCIVWAGMDTQRLQLYTGLDICWWKISCYRCIGFHMMSSLSTLWAGFARYHLAGCVNISLFLKNRTSLTLASVNDAGQHLPSFFFLQPPWDTDLGNKYIIHYTYGCDYNMQVWITVTLTFKYLSLLIPEIVFSLLLFIKWRLALTHAHRHVLFLRGSWRTAKLENGDLTNVLTPQELRPRT